MCICVEAVSDGLAVGLLVRKKGFTHFENWPTVMDNN
ncbi:hypothetical protein APH_0461 [Anaplasma phagocytophilum str. HZ]|uniref:Uncharacterized protein n=1 Tax=Anaplasma phagocytophilum (strain HZ) TaxID=212042 RepID=Q2GKM4_ANAPZ|nr:hypothetical protein APH_0477 [Anaplasma phagocytophilum str. HZ]ABD44110.1 hypothetical protein APH_0461 [Anaplasma phagocytophilum str. HZ]